MSRWTLEARARQSEIMKEKWKDPEYRAKVKENRKYIRNPDANFEISKRMMEKWKDPEYRATRMKLSQDPKSRERQSRIMKEKWRDPEFRARMLASIKNKGSR